MKNDTHNVPGCAFVLAVAALVLWMVPAPEATAQTIDWAVANGNWNTAANWNPQNVPNAAGETARFPAGGGTYTVTVNLSPTLDAVQVLNPTATLSLGSAVLTTLLSPGITNAGILTSTSGNPTLAADMVNSAGGVVSIPGGRTFYLDMGSMTNDGQVQINSNGSASNAYLRIQRSVEFGGSGAIVMQATSSAADANLETSTGVVLTNGASHSIRGTGTISGEFVNNGLVSGVGTAYGLTLDGSVKTNNATMEAPSGGLLILATEVTQSALGRFLASGGTVRLNTGAVITGGTLASEAGGAFICNLSTPHFVDVTNDAEVRILGGVTAQAGGTFLTNNGVIHVNYTNSAADSRLTLADGVTLGGIGEIAMLVAGTDINDASIYADETAWCTHAAGHTIHGGGEVRASLTNEGLIRGDQSGRAITLDMPGMLNLGTVMASAGGRIDIACDSVYQAGSGRILADGGDVRLIAGARVSGGRLETAPGSSIQGYSGTVTVADVHNTGDWRVRPGSTTELRGSTTTNDGTITVNEETAGNSYLRAMEPLTIAGSGAIVLRCLSSSTDANFSTGAGVTCTQGANHTIRGKGRVGAALVNDGTVLADMGGVGIVLADDPKTNRSLIKAVAGGKLTIESTTVTQEGSGRIVAEEGQILLNSAGITGGVVTSSGAGYLRCSSGTSRFTSVTNQGDVRLPSTTVLDVAGGSLVNEGTIRINETGGAGNTYLRAVESALVSGDGEVVLRTAGSMADATVATLGEAVLTVAAGQKIRGEGMIDARMVNQGTIEGDVPGRTLNVTGDPKSNAGLMHASGGGILRFYSGTVTNAALVEAADTSTVSVGGGTLVNDADLVARDAGTAVVEGGVLTNRALARAHSGGRIVQTNGTIDNLGILRAEAQGEVRIDQSVAFRNNGAVEATSDGLFWCDRWADHYNNGTLTGGAWRAIGTGQLRLIGVNVQTLNAEIVLDGPDSRIWSNEGTIDALAGMTALGSGGVFELRGARAFTRGGPLTSAGQVRVGAGSRLDITGRFRQTLGGAVAHVEGTLASPDTLWFDTGFVRGNGRIVGNVHNEGTVEPGSSIGHLTVEGNYSQIGNGTISIELGGTAAGASDLFEVTGSAALDGCLRLRVANGYVPHEGDTIEIARFASRTGSFSQLAICPSAGVCAELVWQPTRLLVVLHVLPTTDVQEPETPEDDAAEGGDAADPGTQEPSQPAEFAFHVRCSGHGVVSILLAIPGSADGEIAVFDVTGRRCATIARGPWSAGEHQLDWNGVSEAGERVPTGIYFATAWIRTDGKPLERVLRLLIIR